MTWSYLYLRKITRKFMERMSNELTGEEIGIRDLRLFRGSGERQGVSLGP